MKSNWNIIERDDKHRLVYIEDTSNQNGGMTVTNDAEAVITFFQLQYGSDWRVVYTDTEGEQWEIIKNHETWMGVDIGFKPWYGLVLDVLSR